MSEVTTIRVETAEEYDVVIGREVLLDQLRNALTGVDKVLVVHQPSLSTVADELKRDIEVSGTQLFLAEVPDAEDAKRIEVAQFLWQIMGQADFTRTDVVIGLGGGAATDLAGFVAATWLRGVNVIQVPTTVLGMVDAAVGGKTGINTELGKNLVGAFHQPSLVIADLALTDTLDRKEILTGFAEVVKCGFIADERILALLEADLEATTNTSTPEFHEAVSRAIRVKAEIVADDTHELGRREFLNYGHTLGHAIEHAERYQWRHGAAISIGMVFAAELGRLAGRLDDATVSRHRRILASLDLPLRYPANRWKTLRATMQRDKKARG
ncbi:MAG TPA: 3-dehydroquinate synthase, partial [Candidatus Agrococcus pullicola]|nr:3-dehydroquinate synthase [Candidatus Agrococcus pullicola]